MTDPATVHLLALMGLALLRYMGEVWFVFVWFLFMWKGRAIQAKLTEWRYRLHKGKPDKDGWRAVANFTRKEHLVSHTIECDDDGPACVQSTEGMNAPAGWAVLTIDRPDPEQAGRKLIYNLHICPACRKAPGVQLGRETKRLLA